ncbi:Fungal_trans domain-containing protein [Pseudozyma hubeiensis]|nr:Fungal_trans domain-containing protein [Pseudozyma hubeiensis]
MEDHASVARVPDEFPTLSNPLKLLAQVGSEESERRRGGGEQGMDREQGLNAEVQTGSRKRARSRSPLPDVSTTQSNTNERQPSSADTTAISTSLAPTSLTPSRSASITTTTPSWSTTYFSRGAFHPVYDNRPEFDPIDRRLLTTTQATRLISSFYSSFGTFMHIFDPALSTFAYIRKHSAFLLTVICAISAEFESSPDPGVQRESAGLAVVLRKHYEGILTWICSGDYKNVEMAQAFFLLASYRPMADSATADQTWLYLGTAIRIATELGCNLVCYSYTNTSRVQGEQEREHYTRQLRNTERLWINLWNLEKTLASQTGQRMHLADEGVVATCSRWHGMDYALRQDEVLVAQVELRRVMMRMVDVFHTHVMKSLGSRARIANATTTTTRDNDDELEDSAEGDQLSLQLSYFRNSVDMDLKRWQERWLSSSPPTNASTPPSPLQITGPLSLDYAALVTYALPLPITYTVDVSAELSQLYRHCYISCTNYMATFIDRCKKGWMDHVTNSTVISTVYAVVFGLDLARKAGKIRQQKGGVDFGFVEGSRVVSLARRTATELEKIGNAKGGRGGRSVASRYSGFLKGLLERFEVKVEMGEEAAEVAGEKRGVQEGGMAANGSGIEQSRPSGAAEHVSDGTSSSSLQAQGEHSIGSSGSQSTTTGDSSRHLRRDHNHPLPHSYTPQPPPRAAASSHRSAGKQGTRASHAYSSNLLFSPQPHQTLPPSSHAQHAPPGPPGPASSWTAPSPYNPPLFTTPRFVPPPHHHIQNADWNHTHAAVQHGGGGGGGGGALSPTTWFNQINSSAPALDNAQNGASTTRGPGVVEELDPSWEWMMADLDFFNVDGGGGGGEPILDQMGRLFG